MSRKLAEKTSDFGKRLKEAFNNISNQSIAEKLKVGNSALTAYIQGRIPPPEKLIEIVRLSNCNLNWLLTGEGVSNIRASVKRPQGIILQGTKGGIGTSTCAVFVAANLALRGYGVLLANDVLNTCFNLIFSQKGKVESTPIGLIHDYQHDYYISTKLENFDLFIPRTMNPVKFPANQVKSFNFNINDISKRYDFVIFDLQRCENPFYYPHNTQLENFYLEPILRNSKVISPYSVLESHLESVISTTDYVEKQKSIYPDVGFAGIFLIQPRSIYNLEQKYYDEQLVRLKKQFFSKIFNTQIEFNLQLSGFIHDIQKIMFSRKTNIYSNFTDLVDELLQKIGY